jgi:hypothetical protein
VPAATLADARSRIALAEKGVQEARTASSGGNYKAAIDSAVKTTATLRSIPTICRTAGVQRPLIHAATAPRKAESPVARSRYEVFATSIRSQPDSRSDRDLIPDSDPESIRVWRASAVEEDLRQPVR